MPRIIAGTARGRRLAVPGRGTRPTADRVRESMFSAIEALLRDGEVAWSQVDVLDLYSGSGALGLEALSRGARTAVLVESDRSALRVLRANCAELALPGAQVLDRSVRALGPRGDGGQAAGLVLADPPYEVAAAEVAQVLARLQADGWVDDGALVVVERAARDADSPLPPGWLLIRERQYGDTRLWYGRSVQPGEE